MAPKIDIQAIIFDLEGVVVDSEKHWDTCAVIFLGRHGFKYQREPHKPLLMGKTLEEGVMIWKKEIGLKGNTKKLAQERRDIIRELYYDTNFTPGFMNFFKKVSKKYKVGIGTSIERHFLKIIDEKLGVTKLFNNEVYSIEDIGFISKPNPDIFLHVAKKLKVKPKQCVVFEDSPNGVEAAKRAGMMCVAITTTTDPKKLNKSDLIIDSFQDNKLKEFL